VGGGVTISRRAGGITGYVGRNFSTEAIVNCYSTGDVSSSGGASPLSVGGIVGEIGASRLVTSSYCPDLYGSPWGTQLTPAQMQLQANYTGWNFSTVWAINPGKNGGTPYLRVFK